MFMFFPPLGNLPANNTFRNKHNNQLIEALGESVKQ